MLQVVIVDDREDVWRGIDSLVRIAEFKYFRSKKEVAGNFPGMAPSAAGMHMELEDVGACSVLMLSYVVAT